MSQEASPKGQLLDAQAFRARHADGIKGARIVLIRHGRPAIAIAPSTSHHGFRSYIDAYEAAGLDPSNAPPDELRDLVAELDSVFTSGRPRAHDSARLL